jgi:hypothetical protein
MAWRRLGSRRADELLDAAKKPDGGYKPGILAIHR